MLVEPAPGVTEPQDDDRACWRVSSGSASVLGLRPAAVDVAPTTAYLMLGERCRRNCAFCAQARQSTAGVAALSRVTWPEFDAEAVAAAVADAHARGAIGRACFQATTTPGYRQMAREAVAQLAAHSAVPVCVSIGLTSPDEVAPLLAAGAQRVSMALDVACPRIYGEIKGGDWHQAVDLLERCAERYPGRIGTHLIVGLGESEHEMACCIQRMADAGITVALFAFTPVRGTAMADRQPPALGHYRRMQVARKLIVERLARAQDFVYDEGRLIGFGPTMPWLREWLRDGEAFRTSGCPDCNRPYYNERPGGILYNYPRPLTPDEVDREIESLLSDLSHTA
ncbi:MAG: radical SAM protein [Anaerolineae bacterium]